ncbi:hypothetical protein OSB04_009588 [Centaurea solstitialis]|uniref:F-box associated domain-containing protein n=1 Tax=Centaurea solstitialis TaxID=347529 RepID=A0AA38WMA0_9ASTR|nr:hypothetical protein OSB04_009588 [Centaurea solstitialis]
MNGLVCVGIQKNSIDDEFSDIILWNPLTGEYKTLSKPIDTRCYSRYSMVFELYYTCSDDDYKILSITTDRNVYIYSLRFDSWRKLESTLDYEDRIPYAGDHNLLDEKLHFLRPLDTKGRCIIIRLDLKTEKFTKIPVPYAYEHKGLSLTVVRGCIELTLFLGSLLRLWMIEMWRMNVDGDWIKTGAISYSHSHNQLTKWCFMNPLSINGNWLGFSRNDICKVDLENDIEEDLWLNMYRYIDVLPRIYIETFVLGYDQPSKAVKWLLKAASTSIDKLPSISFRLLIRRFPASYRTTTAIATTGSNNNVSKSPACSSTSETSKGSGLSLSRSENRVKAQERATEMTSKKEKDKETDSARGSVRNQVNNISENDSFTDVLTGGINGTAVRRPNPTANPESRTTPMDYFFSRSPQPPSSHLIEMPPFNLTAGDNHHHNRNHQQDHHHFSFLQNSFALAVTTTVGGVGTISGQLSRSGKEEEGFEEREKI